MNPPFLFSIQDKFKLDWITKNVCQYFIEKITFSMVPGKKIAKKFAVFCQATAIHALTQGERYIYRYVVKEDPFSCRRINPIARML